ncbi:MAG: peptide deformylase, partial [Corynebacterium variabile]|nr:peptide deformylase [Corynebacterium variabile]
VGRVVTLRTLVEDMYETMDAAGGVGLAANQVGVTRRVFVYDCDGDRGHIVNPVWEAVGAETQTGREGCLSVPDAGGDVTRAATVHLTGVTVDGEEVDREVTGLMARCVQHETDHLDGVMYFQRMEPGTRREVMAGIRGSEWFNR